MRKNIIYLLKLIGMSLECAFCMGIIVRLFLERSKITFERCLCHGAIGAVGTLLIHFKVADVAAAEVYIYGLWALVLICCIYKGPLFYKMWAIWVANMIMYMAIGFVDLIVRVVFMQILGFSLVDMQIVETYFWLPEMIGAIVGVYIFKKTPFYYKDKVCYQQLSVVRKLMILVITTGMGTVVQASVLALDGSAQAVAKGSIKAFLKIYAGLIVSIMWILQTYKDIHKTYDNREDLLISSFSKKQVETAQQLEKLDKANQEVKEGLYHNVRHLARVAGELGLEDAGMYAEQLAVAVAPRNQEFLLTGHSVLDAVLKEKYVAAVEKNIHFANKISIPNHVALSSTDLSIIVGQALDYAIRRCEGVEGNRNIKVEGVWYKGYIILKVWHSNPRIEVEEALKDKELELGIIQKYVSKYEGEFKTSIEQCSSKLELSFNARA